ncbi:MAG: hypothetical protein EBY18_19805 [Alphaproteobacteria bacterium]|nr:hypothetical protein [Alphaproteobacteria bacterium]
MASDTLPKPTFQLTAIRLSISLVQGAAVWLLYQSRHSLFWSTTNEELLSSLLATAFFVPVLALAGAGNLRPKTLALWLVCAASLCLWLGWHAIFRQASVPLDRRNDFAWVDFYVPMIGLFFVAHALVASADKSRHVIADTATYFETVWKQVAQVAFACALVGTLWSMLHLCARLLQSINVGMLTDVITTSWVWIPVTTMTAAVAFDLADRHTAPILALVERLLRWFSWLLLLAVPRALAYLIFPAIAEHTLPWSAKYGIVDLLGIAGTLIFLINVRNLQGDSRTNPSRVLLYARFTTVFLVLCLVIVAAMRLRTMYVQFGWLPLGVILFVWWLVLACHAIGYTMTAVRSGIRLQGLAAVNAVSAMGMVVLTIALLSPVADPARLSVANQLNRLASGQVAPDKFDYLMLRYEGVRYGWQALERLKGRQEGADALLISSKAAAALEAE